MFRRENGFTTTLSSNHCRVLYVVTDNVPVMTLLQLTSRRALMSPIAAAGVDTSPSYIAFYEDVTPMSRFTDTDGVRRDVAKTSHRRCRHDHSPTSPLSNRRTYTLAGSRRQHEPLSVDAVTSRLRRDRSTVPSTCSDDGGGGDRLRLNTADVNRLLCRHYTSETSFFQSRSSRMSCRRVRAVETLLTVFIGLLLVVLMTTSTAVAASSSVPCSTALTCVNLTACFNDTSTLPTCDVNVSLRVQLFHCRQPFKYYVSVKQLSSNFPPMPAKLQLRLLTRTDVISDFQVSKNAQQ